MRKDIEFKREDSGCYDMEKLIAAADWHKKRYSTENGITYKFYDGEGVCVYTFYGDWKMLKTIDRFVKFYRWFWGRK